jgi:DNA polymerase-3 subunit delta
MWVRRRRIVSCLDGTLVIVKPIVTVVGPAQAGPGERELMLAAARDALDQLEVDDVLRIDVPGKGSGEETEDSGLRAAVAGVVPALQSGSLFGDRAGCLVVDANQLNKAEAEVIAELVQAVPQDGSVVAVFVAAGSILSPLGKALRSLGETVSISRVTERTAAGWLATAARERGLKLEPEAASSLIQRFGTDVGALSRALDQLAVDGDRVSAEAVRDRFKNRPDEPMWHLADAVVAGDTGQALRRLEDFLIHGHPLQLLAFLQNDVRRRCLAAASDDYETFVDRDGGRKGYAMEKVWKQRNQSRATDLRKALGALARADLQLKTTPEPTHRVTMERLTVALCHWYGGRGR